MSSIKQHFEQVHERIHLAEKACHRKGQVKLLAVSKKKPAVMVQMAYEQGQRHFGESYIQEALKKIDALSDLAELCWHFIGPIQSNKTCDIAEHFNWVHSVDRLKIAQRLNDQRPKSLPPLNICLQVNISEEASKSGASLNEVPWLVAKIADLPKLKLRGLMAIPTSEADPIKQREPFKALADLQAALNQSQNINMDTLSMGMTGDLEAAITEGATIVRIGTALFGSRDSSLKG